MTVGHRRGIRPHENVIVNLHVVRQVRVILNPDVVPYFRLMPDVDTGPNRTVIPDGDVLPDRRELIDVRVRPELYCRVNHSPLVDHGEPNSSRVLPDMDLTLPSKTRLAAFSQ